MKALMSSMRQPGLETMNFYSVHRLPPREGLMERRGEIVKGMVNVWYEYIPASYNGSVEVPLVVQLHGGGQDGRRWVGHTLWHKLADTRNFIVIYPNSPNYGIWKCDQTDVDYLYDLIDVICDKYKIDKTRIFMQGMSNGDMMALAFSMKHAEVLAAAGFITGPASAEALDGDRPEKALPMIQMRGELDVNWMLTPETEDVYAARYGMNDLNYEIWERVNGTEQVCPTVWICGKDNFLYYEGKKAPIILWEVQGMGHREPAYSAQVLWERLYSGCSRREKSIEIKAPEQPIPILEDTVLIALGSNKALRGNRILPISSLDCGITRILLPAEMPRFCPVHLDEMGETEVMCAPTDIFMNLFGADMTSSPTGESVRLRFENGLDVVLHAQTEVIEVNGEFRGMQKPCALLGGVLYVPVAELCQMLLGKHVSIADDVMCISDHYAVLGRYTARIVRRLLGGESRPRPRADRV